MRIRTEKGEGKAGLEGRGGKVEGKEKRDTRRKMKERRRLGRS